MSRIFEIVDRVHAYAPRADLDRIRRAYVFAAMAHVNQRRSSGVNYITHPLAVAGILTSLRLDEASVVAALLHDTVEDTHVTLDDVRGHFGDEVAKLVDGVTKIGQIHFRSSEHKQAENFRKMILATAQDLRVLLIKLADRLHNMRTLGFLPERKRRVISDETVKLYAPLAHRLGIHWIKQEMEDLAFSHLEVEGYARLTARMSERLDFLHTTRERLETLLQEALDRHGVEARVQGRLKHLYSIHDKMQRKHVDFDDIFDLVAFRIIVDDTPTCYHTLGIIHSLYRPVPGRFKDYIALPKPNGYQSLHTTIIGPENYRMEVQIRTEAMHRYAEDGVAAHWQYKGGRAKPRDQENFQWLKQLTELVQESDNPGEFIDSVRLDLLVQEVYVFSRDGDVFSLPLGSMPLDFAYAVHTDVGHHCIGVRINGEPADFQTRLHNGDEIEVMTSPDQTPSRHWLQYVKTPRARQAIRQWFRRQEHGASVRMGEQVLREAVGAPEVDRAVLERLKCDDLEALKMKVGRGDLSVTDLLEAVDRDSTRPLRIRGMASRLIHPADCCHPIPGDPVVGTFRSGRGMLVHHRFCPEVHRSREAWLDVHWRPGEGQSYPTGIEVRTRNRRGMLAQITRAIAEAGSNIDDVRIRQFGGDVTTISLLVEVVDRKQLAIVLRLVKALDGVVRVSRSSVIAPKGGSRRVRRFGRALREMVRRGFSRQDDGA